MEDPELSDLLVLMDKLLRETSPLSPMSLVLPKPEMVQWPVLRCVKKPPAHFLDFLKRRFFFSVSGT